MDGKPWRIEVLRAIRLRYRHGRWLPLVYQKPVALLLYLATYPHRPHPREALSDRLWPNSDLEAGRNTLRVTLHSLRRLLESTGGAADPLLRVDRSTLSLDPAAFSTDLEEYRAAVSEAARARTPEERSRALGEAAACYRGEFLPGFYDAWVLEERERLLTTQRDLLQQLVHVREELGDAAAALSAAREMVSLDPLWEEAHYEVMRLYAALGQPSACLRQYQELERILHKELEETPSAQARALAEEMRDSARTLVVARRSSPPPSALLPETAPVPEAGPPPQASNPPHRPTAAFPTRLPVQMTRFYGRQEEIARLMELLASPVTRLVTVTGLGGSGKTRLAIAAAARMVEVPLDLSSSRKAVAFVALADVTDAARVPDAIADALGIERSPAVEVVEQVISHLATQPWLLVLDNFEHLVDEGALWVRTLLERVPMLTCLVTSRQRLGITGEQEFALLPLPTPRRGAGLDQLGEYASVQLFVDRARVARAEFSLTPGNGAAVAELCDRLDGLPLAIELAASRIAVLSPEALLGQLERRFAFLVTRQRDTPARHRTLRTVMESSYQLLSSELRRFFVRLSVFRGAWTLEAAEAVCEGEGGKRTPSQALEFLEQLRDCSLLTVVEDGRYRLLETVREFAAEQLGPEERRELERRHAAFFLELAQRADAAAEGEEGAARLQELEREHDNLRAALDGCLQSDPSHDARMTEDVERGLALGAALGSFWIPRCYFAEGLRYLTALLARSGTIRSRDRARALIIAGRLTGYQSGASAASHRLLEEGLALARALEERSLMASALLYLVDQAPRHLTAAQRQALCEEALALYRELGDRRGMAVAQVTMGLICITADARRASAFFEEGAAALRQLGSSSALAWACFHQRHAQYFLGEYEPASEVGRESLPLFEKYADLAGIAACHELQGAIALARGDLPTARRHFERDQAYSLEVGNQSGTAGSSTACYRLGDVALAEGNLEAAEALYQRALAIARETNGMRQVIEALTGLGRAALFRDDAKAAASRFLEALSINLDWDPLRFALPCVEGLAGALTLEAGQVGDPGPRASTAATPRLLRAARLFGAAEAVRERTGFQRPPQERSEQESWIATLRASLEEADFTAAWEAGRALSWEEMIACALGESPGSDSASAPSPSLPG